MLVFWCAPGCYDGCVYFLSTNSGKTQWTFETGDAVKSCPAVDPHTGLVIVGSHDGHVYALNPKVWHHFFLNHVPLGFIIWLIVWNIFQISLLVLTLFLIGLKSWVFPFSCSSVFGSITVEAEQSFLHHTSSQISVSCLWHHWGVSSSVYTLWVKVP